MSSCPATDYRALADRARRAAHRPAGVPACEPARHAGPKQTERARLPPDQPTGRPPGCVAPSTLDAWATTRGDRLRGGGVQSMVHGLRCSGPRASTSGPASPSRSGPGPPGAGATDCTPWRSAARRRPSSQRGGGFVGSGPARPAGKSHRQRARPLMCAGVRPPLARPAPRPRRTPRCTPPTCRKGPGPRWSDGIGPGSRNESGVRRTAGRSSHGRGHRFESCYAHQITPGPRRSPGRGTSVGIRRSPAHRRRSRGRVPRLDSAVRASGRRTGNGPAARCDHRDAEGCTPPPTGWDRCG